MADLSDSKRDQIFHARTAAASLKETAEFFSVPKSNESKVRTAFEK